jgi:hypothetical protein
MTFVLKQSATYNWPIPLELPADGGRKDKFSFDGEFRRLPQSRINEIIKVARAMEYGRSLDDEELDDKTAAREILVGWTGVVDDDGKEIPFSDAALGQLLEIPTIGAQIIRAWFDSMDVAKKQTSRTR